MEKYVAPNTTINESIATLSTAKQKIDELSKELSTEKEKPFATRLVEAIKKIRVSKSQEHESSEQEISGKVSEVIENLEGITASYQPALNDDNLSSIKTRLNDRKQSAKAQLGNTTQTDKLVL